MLKKYISRIKSFEDYVKYYQKIFNFVAQKMIRKIAKLYAMTGTK